MHGRDWHAHHVGMHYLTGTQNVAYYRVVHVPFTLYISNQIQLQGTAALRVANTSAQYQVQISPMSSHDDQATQKEDSK